MSIRLFWMTSVLEGKHPVGDPLLAEKTSPTPDAEDTSQLKSFFSGAWHVVRNLLITISIMALTALAASAILSWRRDSINGRPIRFPERDLPMRLGGSHSGGSYIGMTFAPPTARSKDQA